jgi:quinolinate synthase
MTPDIYHGVADFVGDSLALAIEATKVKEEYIVLAGVHFMAETAKILNYEKTVLIPDTRAGCSLAESITGADVRALKAQYPGRPVVTYVNTSAEVKAETDICCTSGNALKVVESLDADEIIFIPDQYLGKNIQKQTKKKLIFWKGHCEVHVRFNAAQIREYRNRFDNAVVIAHPECPLDVTEEADFIGSTAKMIDFVKENKPKRVMMITECSMSDNVAGEFPDIEFIRPCNLCPHMQRITLPKILQSLETLNPRVEVPREVADRARLAVERMIAIR